MSDKSFHLKVFLSAIVGLFIGATLVYFPGVIFMKGSWPPVVYEIFNADLQLITKGIPVPDELRSKTKWLCIALIELNCLPFLLFCSCVGPTVLTMRRSRSKT